MCPPHLVGMQGFKVLVQHLVRLLALLPFESQLGSLTVGWLRLNLVVVVSSCIINLIHIYYEKPYCCCFWSCHHRSCYRPGEGSWGS